MTSVSGLLIALSVLLVSCANGSAQPPVAVTVRPPPQALSDAAAPFGFDAIGEGWSWTKLDASATRFDWSGRPTAGDREVLLSFWMSTIDPVSAKFLPTVVQAAAANLTEDNHPCEPFEQPEDIARVLHVERVITVCFEASQAYGKGRFKKGVLHGIVNHGTLTVIAVLSNGHAGIVPIERRRSPSTLEVNQEKSRRRKMSAANASMTIE